MPQSSRLHFDQANPPVLWLFNIRQHNWEPCRQGPSESGEHDGEPWHGIKKTSKDHPRDVDPGDIVVARRVTRTEGGKTGTKDHGALGLWKFDSCRRVKPDEDLPWPEEYKYVLYCQAIERAFERPFTENFNSLPFDQSSMQRSIRRLATFERIAYLEQLIGFDQLHNETRRMLRDLLSAYQN